MGAFAYIVNKVLLLQCGLMFGSDFSPASWEVVRRIIEQLAETLFDDKTLVAKHRKYLDRLQWQGGLGSKKAKFVTATRDTINRGVLDAAGQPVKTPHDMFVDDMVYADVFEQARTRVEQAAAPALRLCLTCWAPPTSPAAKIPSHGTSLRICQLAGSVAFLG